MADWLSWWTLFVRIHPALLVREVPALGPRQFVTSSSGFQASSLATASGLVVS